jgi:hypothetical protein
MADPIIIVDGQGTEHEFPAGFDPAKAASIVRQASAPPAPSPLERVWGAIRHPMTSVVPSLAGHDDAPVTLGDLRSDPMGSLRRAGRILGTDATTPALVASVAAPFVLPGGIRAVAKLPVREPLGAALQAGGKAMQHPVRLPGKMVQALGKRISGESAPPAPADPNAAPDIAGFERYPRPEPAQAGPPSSKSTTSAGFTSENVDSRISGYEPVARVRTPGQAAAPWEERNLLDKFGGSARIPTSAELELVQRLGQPSDAEMQMAISHRNAGTRWPTPAVSHVPTPPGSALNTAMEEAVQQAVRRKVHAKR